MTVVGAVGAVVDSRCIRRHNIQDIEVKIYQLDDDVWGTKTWFHAADLASNTFARDVAYTRVSERNVLCKLSVRCIAYV